MLVFQIIVTALPAFMVVMTLLNFATLRSPVSRTAQTRFTSKDAPLVSILVPARNEATNITRCVRSLLKQDYPNYEVLVLDDSSEDATASLVEGLTFPTKDPQGRLHLLRGGVLPEGWLGKNFACHQLAQAARGEYLLFTDADTSHSVNALTSTMAVLQEEKSQFLSLFPRQETVGLAERLAVPLTQVFICGLLPTWLVRRSPNPGFSAANGQFMLFGRNAYERIGGHEAVRAVVLEDVTLGRRIKQAGLSQSLPDGREVVTCRMYRTSSEVWRGFSKNLFAFFGFKLGWLLLFLLLNWCAFVLPYGWLLGGWLSGQAADATWLWLPLAQIGLAWILRLLLVLRFGFPPLDIFLHPFSILYMTAIAANSVRWSRVATEWKGRKYPSFKKRASK